MNENTRLKEIFAFGKEEREAAMGGRNSTQAWRHYPVVKLDCSLSSAPLLLLRRLSLLFLSVRFMSVSSRFWFFRSASTSLRRRSCWRRLSSTSFWMRSYSPRNSFTWSRKLYTVSTKPLQTLALLLHVRNRWQEILLVARDLLLLNNTDVAFHLFNDDLFFFCDQHLWTVQHGWK